VTEVRWAPDAARDFENHANWYRDYKASTASRFVTDVEKAIARIILLPSSGRVHLGRPDRRLVSLPKWHKIIHYRVQDGHLHVLALLDTRMLDASD
jgi:plasmid stabilization system protein ParE